MKKVTKKIEKEKAVEIKGKVINFYCLTFDEWKDSLMVITIASNTRTPKFFKFYKMRKNLFTTKKEATELVKKYNAKLK